MKNEFLECSETEQNKNVLFVISFDLNICMRISLKS